MVTEKAPDTLFVDPMVVKRRSDLLALNCVVTRRLGS
jgi:hypothetical protein